MRRRNGLAICGLGGRSRSAAPSRCSDRAAGLGTQLNRAATSALTATAQRSTKNDPVYRAVLTVRAELELALATSIRRVARPHQRGSADWCSLETFRPLPSAIHEPRNQLRRRSTVAYSREAKRRRARLLAQRRLPMLPKASVTPYLGREVPRPEAGPRCTAATRLLSRQRSPPPTHGQKMASSRRPAKPFRGLSFVELSGEQQIVGKGPLLTHQARGALAQGQRRRAYPCHRPKRLGRQQLASKTPRATLQKAAAPG